MSRNKREWRQSERVVVSSVNQNNRPDWLVLHDPCRLYSLCIAALLPVLFFSLSVIFLVTAVLFRRSLCLSLSVSVFLMVRIQLLPWYVLLEGVTTRRNSCLRPVLRSLLPLSFCLWLTHLLINSQLELLVSLSLSGLSLFSSLFLSHTLWTENKRCEEKKTAGAVVRGWSTACV